MIDTYKIIDTIQSHDTYKQILADSFGGIMYNVANRNKYDEGKTELLELWEQVENKDCADGILKGAMNFIQGN